MRTIVQKALPTIAMAGLAVLFWPRVAVPQAKACEGCTIYQGNEYCVSTQIGKNLCGNDCFLTGGDCPTPPSEPR